MAVITTHVDKGQAAVVKLDFEVLDRDTRLDVDKGVPSFHGTHPEQCGIDCSNVVEENWVDKNSAVSPGDVRECVPGSNCTNTLLQPPGLVYNVDHVLQGLRSDLVQGRAALFADAVGPVDIVQQGWRVGSSKGGCSLLGNNQGQPDSLLLQNVVDCTRLPP